MKKLAAAVAILALASMPVAFACDNDKTAQAPAEFGKGPVKDVVLTGYLTDSNCGAKNATASGKSCALHCIKDGARVQLMADKTLYTIEKLDNPADHLGHEVKVTGKLDTSTNVIRVTSIESVAKS
jgi:hypothetical protein